MVVPPLILGRTLIFAAVLLAGFLKTGGGTRRRELVRDCGRENHTARPNLTQIC